MYRRFLLFWLILAAGVFLSGCGSEEPAHQGKPLSKWLAQLDSQHVAPHKEAVEALVAMGPPVLPFLSRHLDHSDMHGRCGAATAMLRLDPELALPQVRQRMLSDVPRMRLGMCMALVRANVEPGLAIPLLAEMMNHEDCFMRNGAIKTFSDFKPQSTGAVPALSELLRQYPDAEVRQRAAYALSRIGPAAAAAVPALCGALADSCAPVREASATALAAMGPAAKNSEEALRTALNDSDPKVRFRAAKALDAVSAKQQSERAAN